jgi:hypothetical protein
VTSPAERADVRDDIAASSKGTPGFSDRNRVNHRPANSPRRSVLQRHERGQLDASTSDAWPIVRALSPAAARFSRSMARRKTVRGFRAERPARAYTAPAETGQRSADLDHVKGAG